MNSIYNKILNWKAQNKKTFALLIDPDKYVPTTLQQIYNSSPLPDLIFVGGSLVMNDTTKTITNIKSITQDKTPIVLFPGDYSQISPNADALLLLSLVSGRNPEYLIGQHTKAALRIKQIGIETIPTAYMLIDGGRVTSVQYISGTTPLPADKTDLSTATALASEMLGMKMIYLEAGSGALNPVPKEIISAIRQNVNIPLIVGGGLRSPQAIKNAFDAGADIVVIGTAIEQNLTTFSSLLSNT